MHKEYSRSRRVAALVQRQLADILQREERFSGDMLTVSAVQVDPDLARAKVFVTCLHDAPEHHQQLLRTLNEEAAEYRHLLAGKLSLRGIPRLEFRYDRFPEEVRSLDRLLSELRESEASGPEDQHS